MKFTEMAIKSLKPRVIRYEVCETNSDGFCLRITPNGTKTWITRYRKGGKLIKVTIGTYPGKSIKEARAEHNRNRELLDNRIDVREARELERRQAEATHQAEVEAGTVAELIDEYIEKWSKKHKKSWREDQRILAKDVTPLWGKRKAKDITRRDVIRLLDGIVERGAPISAARTFEVIRRMFRFAVERDIIDTSPCFAVRRPAKAAQRDRVFSPDEIKSFWQNVDEINAHRAIKLALKLQLITAQRRGEISTAEWSEIDLSDGWWTIPAAKAKNGLAHRVPLTPTAIEILEELKSIAGDSPYILPSPQGEGKKPMRDGAVTRAVARNREAFGVAQFTPHDLRRTAASQMAGIGVPRLVISKILNHVETGVTAIYDRHSYDSEKRIALEKWDNRLKVLTGRKESDNVIPMVRA